MRLLIILLLLLTSQLFASKILSYNIYERTDRVDMMLTFDTPYEGTIKQRTTNSKIIIKLSDAQIEAPKEKNVRSEYVKKITLAYVNKETQIIASIKPDTKLYVSKTSDSYGLRLRFSKAKLKTKASPLTTATQSQNALQTKPETTLSLTYIVVVVLLLLALIILVVFKKNIVSPSSKSWLSLQREAKEDVNIRFQKALDTKNRVVMLDYEEESYLVILGESNILLDKFEGNSIRKESQFDSMLNEKRDTLDSFLQIDTQDKDETLSTYKEKASNLDYHL